MIPKKHRRSARHNKGSVAIEAALCLMTAILLLIGTTDLVLELRLWLRVNALASHIGQVVAQSDTLSDSSVLAAMTSGLAAEGTLLANAGVTVTVIGLSKSGESGGSIRQQTGNGCASAYSSATVSATQFTSLGAGGATAIVAVDTCTPAQPWPVNFSLLFGGKESPALHGSAVLASIATLSE